MTATWYGLLYCCTLDAQLVLNFSMNPVKDGKHIRDLILMGYNESKGILTDLYRKMAIKS